MALQDNALITVQQLVDRLALVGIDASTQTSFLESLINSMSDNFESHCNRTFKTTVITDYEVVSPDRQVITVPQRPIQSIEKITYNGIELDSKADDELGGYYIKNANSGEIAKQDGWGFAGFINNNLEYSKDFDNNIINIVIDYTGGYDTIPSNLQEACIDECIREYQFKTGDYRNTVSERTQSVSIKFSEDDIDSDTGWLSKTVRVLSKYENIVVL